MKSCIIRSISIGMISGLTLSGRAVHEKLTDQVAMSLRLLDFKLNLQNLLLHFGKESLSLIQILVHECVNSGKILRPRMAMTLKLKNFLFPLKRRLKETQREIIALAKKSSGSNIRNCLNI